MRLRHFGVAMFGLACIASSIASHAAPPIHLSFAVDETFPSTRFSRACGFPVWRHETGTVRITLFQDANGVVVRETDTVPGFKTVWFSPVQLGGTGGSFTSPSSASLKTSYPEGVFVGAPAIMVFTGLQVAVPGLPQAGREVFLAEVAFVDEAGVPFTEPLEQLDSRGHFTDAAPFAAALCAALASP